MGAYGETDPHMAWRAEQKHVAITRFPTTHLLKGTLKTPDKYGELSDDPELKPATRDTTRNRGLFIAKKSGRKLWSTSYLRFSWTEATAAQGFELDSKCGDAAAASAGVARYR